ncbi:MAG: hypothetical protein J0L66_12575 [Cytophagales bacterium]|nr:hypothetical protein [Cytophagales bacterium]
MRLNNKPRVVFTTLLVALSTAGYAQDLMNMLDQETEKQKKPDYVTATFKTTRIINGHSVENVARGVLDFRISHRFGFLSSGVYELFGLDQAAMRMGLDYGLSKRWMIGVGRSTYQKQFDGFTKYKVISQVADGMPVTVSAVAGMMYKSLKFDTPDRENFLTSKLYYSAQLLVARKFSESLSLQLMPTVIHYNLATGINDPNDVFSVGAGGRMKLSRRVSLNAEYYYQIPGHQLAGTQNSLALGFDIETGGHVFQLNVTNSTGMTERSFISETTGNFFKGDIRFGFTISRVFTIVKPKY